MRPASRRTSLHRGRLAGFSRSGRLLYWVPFLVAVAAVLMAMGLWLGGGDDPRHAAAARVDLSEPVIDDPADGSVGPETVLRLAVTPAIVPARALPSYRGLADYLASQVGRPSQLLQRSSYADVNNLLRYGRCDLALVCTYPFVRGERDFGLRLLAVPQIGGRKEYHSLVIVPASSDATSLLDLYGKRFASADLMSNSGWCFPMSWLIAEGRDPDSFFAEHLITGSHDQSVKAVAAGLADGAAVDSLVYDQMVAGDARLAGQTRVILKSPPFGMPPLVVAPSIDPGLEQDLREAALRMHQDEAGRAVLDTIGIDRFLAPESALYDSVRRLSENLERGR